MALTTLDPRTALLVVDLQKGLVGIPTLHSFAEIVAKTRVLIDAFRRHDLPIVLITVAGTSPGRTEERRRMPDVLPDDFSDLLPELGRQSQDILITKRSWGAFTGTDLEARLRAERVTQVVVAGVATATGVEATARQAFEAAFNVTLAIDAMTDTRAEAHAYSVSHVFPRLGETGTVRDITDLLHTRVA